MDARRALLKKSVLVLLIGVVVFILVLFVYRYLNQGLLVVNVEANSPTIVIKNKISEEIIKESSKSLEVKLEKGSYTVEALDSNGGVTSTFADIKARSTTKINLEVNDLKISQKLKDISALDVAEINNGLMFVQGNSQLLQKIDLDSGTLSSDHANIPQAKKIEVDDQGNGYLLTYRNLIYKLEGSKNTNIRETVLKNAGVLGTPRDIEYHPESGKLFISAGNKVYLLDSGETAANLEYESPWAISRISYEGGDWMSLSQYSTAEPSDEFGNNLDENTSLALHNITTQEFIEIDKSTALQNESMSPGGENLAYYKDNSLVIYNAGKKEVVANLPIKVSSVPKISWCSDKKVLFSDSEGVWVYQIGGSSYRSLLSKKSNVTALECSDDIAYIGTFKHPHNGEIYMISLTSNNNQLPTALSSALPYTGNTVIVDYTFASKKPIVNVRILLPKDLYGLRKGDRGYLSAKIYQDQARKEAKQYLQDNGINLNDIKIVYELG